MSEEFDERPESPDTVQTDVNNDTLTDVEQPDAELSHDTWAEAQAGRNKKTYRWYLSIIGEMLLVIPIILVLVLLRRLFG